MSNTAPSTPKKASNTALLEQARKLIQQQQNSDAQSILHQIIREDPNLAEAWHLLGAIAHHDNRIKESMDFFKQCLFLDPLHFRCAINLGISFRTQKMFDKAAALFKQAIEINSKHADGQINLCLTYMEAEDDLGWHFAMYQLLKADPLNEKLHRAALHPLLSHLKPEKTELWLLRLHRLFGHILTISQYLAIFYEKNDQAEKGLPFITSILKSRPNDPNLLEIHGVLLHRNHEIEASRKVLNHVLEIDKNHAGAHHNLGISYFEQGEMDKGEKHLVKAIKLKPGFTQAYYSLSQIYKFKDKNDHYLKTMEKMLTATNVTEADQIELCFALGKASEDLKDYDKAFAYYNKGNKLKKFPYEKEALWALLERKKKTFTPEFFNEKKGISLSEEAPIFIVGMPRSGTTLVEQILSSHREVSAAGELPYISGICESMKLGGNLSKIYPEVLSHMTSEVITQMAGAYTKNTEKFRHGLPYVTDKMPYNFNHLGFITLLFPNAKLIHCQRNPLDTISSCFSQNFRRLQKMGGTLEAMADYYLYYDETMKLWNDVLPTPIISVSYEKLVQDPTVEIKKLIAACSLDWDKECLEFYNNKRHVRTASISQVRKPIYQSSKDRWKRYEKAMTKIIPVLEKGGVL